MLKLNIDWAYQHSLAKQHRNTLTRQSFGGAKLLIKTTFPPTAI